MIRLYDENNKIQRRCIITDKDVIHLYSHRSFNIGILKVTSNTTNTPWLFYDNGVKSNALKNVNHFTVYIPDNDVSLLMYIENDDSDGYTFLIKREDGNQITDENSHYTDLITNKGLPSYDQIKGALIPDSNYDSREVVKKLLLDFYRLLYNKGTKNSIENFFKYCGYEDYTDKKLLVSDIIEDGEKTGYYNVIYHLWNEYGSSGSYDENGMPDTYLGVIDIDSFKEHIKNAIDIANDYFTAEEQIIKTFDIQYNCNIPIFQSITARNWKHSVYDTAYFRHDVKINLTTYDEFSKFPEIRIKNNQLISDVLPRHEVKFLQFPTHPIPNDEFYEIQEELYEDTEVTESILNDISNGFASIIHLSISIPKLDDAISTKPLDIEFYLETTSNKYHYEKTEYTSDIQKIFVLFKNTTYTLTVLCYDRFGAVEKYYYNMKMESSHTRISIDCYNSGRITSLNDDSVVYEKLNPIQQSPTLQRPITIEYPSGEMKNYILPMSSIPQNLSDYFNQSETPDTKWLMPYDLKNVSEMNMYWRLGDVSDTIPMAVIDSYVDVVSTPYVEGDEIKMLVFDSFDKGYKWVSIDCVSSYNKSLDTIITQAVPVYKDSSTSETSYELEGNYWILYGLYCGIDINLNILGIYRNGTIIQLNSDNCKRKKQYIYVDVPIDITTSTSYRTPIKGTVHIPETPYYNLLNDDVNDVIKVPSIKSIFSHLTRNNYSLKLGDVIYSQLCPRYIDYPFDCEWEITDSFDNSLVLYKSYNKNCVFRFNLKSIIDIRSKFYLSDINGDLQFEKELKSVNSYVNI